MSDIVIRADNLGKKYRIQHQRERQHYVALRDVFAGKMLAPWRWIKSQSVNGHGRVVNPQSAIRNPQSVEDFWALKDVSFEIRQGEVVGIIGRNGAGKSTLLKILSRITEPTEGRVGMCGRVASLLEVGTGFHPELTGRENVFLNGAILGMRRSEIAAKFDEIVEFAGIEKFLDTPVKRYSSGMYMRLAFAVAAHLEPELLIVDEVLSVGDAQFQKKCLGKMDEVARGGRTVLFVSHNLAAVERLCTKVIALDSGRVTGIGKPRPMISAYLREGKSEQYCAGARTGKPQLLSAAIGDLQGRQIAEPVCTEAFLILLTYELPEDAPGTKVGIGILSAEGLALFTSNTGDDGLEIPARAGVYEAQVLVPANLLLADNFHLAVCLWNQREILDLQEPALSFAVDPGGSPLYQQTEARKGFIHVDCRWAIQSKEEAAEKVFQSKLAVSHAG